MNSLLDATLATCAFLASAFLLLLAARRASAALRHRLLAAAIVAAAATVVLQIVVPTSWKLSVLPQPPTSAGTAAVDSPLQLSSATASSPERPRPSESTAGSARRLILTGWMTGVAANLLFLIVGLVQLAWLGLKADDASDEWTTRAVDISADYELRRPVRVLQTSHPTLLVTWGFRRPVVILPRLAPHWSADRIRIVLGHEFAHIRRRDWLVQMIAELLRCLQWFNPLVWIACRRLRQESEYACDDIVLRTGIEGSEYATHLLDLARSMVDQRAAWSPALAIARPSTLERRIRAMLNIRINRTPLSKGGGLLTSIACVAATVPIAAVTTAPQRDQPRHSVFAPAKVVRLNVLARTDPTLRIVRHAGVVEGTLLESPAQTFASLSGTLFDPFGGLLPGVTLTLVNGSTSAKQEVHSDRSGRFEFVGLPAGEYAFTASLPGFTNVRDTVAFTAGDTIQRNFTMQIGSITETVTVTDKDNYPAGYGTQASGAGRGSQPACSAPVAGGIGGNIRSPKRIVNVRPVYPTGSRDAKVQGVVILQGHINTAGFVENLQALRSPNPDLASAAIEAVSGWRFEATQLNCVPIDTVMTVTINFQLAQ